MLHQRKIQKHTALYVGYDCARQNPPDRYLQCLGLDLDSVSTISDAQQKLYKKVYDVLMIQFDSFQRQIFDFCTSIRIEHNGIIIIVLMSRAKPIIESKLFENGIDDVAIGKQIHPVALKSRIKRRLFSRFPITKTSKIKPKGGVFVDLKRAEVRLNNMHHRLNGVLYKLFLYFLENPHRPISRSELLNSHIWDNSVCISDNGENGRAIDMAVSRLRRLIEPDPTTPQIITTIHGVGWILADDLVL